MSKAKRFPFTDTPVHAIQGRRQSSASGTHAQGPARERSRSAARKAAIKRGF